MFLLMGKYMAELMMKLCLKGVEIAEFLNLKHSKQVATHIHL